MEGKFAILRRGPNYNNTDGLGYNTLQQAADDGAVTMAYGYLPSSSTAEPI
jgi:large conductance mechanosensitive channel